MKHVRMQINNEMILMSLIMVISFFLRFLGLENGILGGDGAQYATVARNSLHGFWFYPTLDRVDIFDKPPLFFWLLATGMLLFGENELGARFFPALLGALTPLLVYLLVKRHYGLKAGLYASVLVGVLPFFVQPSRTAFMESTIGFYTVFTIYLFVRGIEEKNPSFFYFSALLIAINFLTKLWEGLLPLVALIPYLYSLGREKLGQCGFFKHGSVALALGVLLSSSYYIASVILDWRFRLWGGATPLWKLLFSGFLASRVFAENAPFQEPWYYYLLLFTNYKLGFIAVPSLVGFALMIYDVKKNPNTVLYISLMLSFVLWSASQAKVWYYIYPLAFAFTVYSAFAFANTQFKIVGLGFLLYLGSLLCSIPIFYDLMIYLTDKAYITWMTVSICLTLFISVAVHLYLSKKPPRVDVPIVSSRTVATVVLILVIITGLCSAKIYAYKSMTAAPDATKAELIEVCKHLVHFLQARNVPYNQVKIFVTAGSSDFGKMVHPTFMFYLYPYPVYKISSSMKSWQSNWIFVYIIDQYALSQYSSICRNIKETSMNITPIILPNANVYSVYVKGINL